MLDKVKGLFEYIYLKLGKIWLMRDIILPVSLYVFIFPPPLNLYPRFTIALRMISYGLAIICVVLFIVNQYYKEKDFPAWIFWMIYFSWIWFVSYYMTGKTPSFYKYCIYFSIIIVCSFLMKNYPRQFTGLYSLYLCTMLVLNTVTWKEGGMYVNRNGQASFILGTKTSLTYYQILACMFICLYYYFAKKKSRAVALGIILNVAVVVWNIRQPISTSIVCLAAFDGYLFMYKLGRKLYMKVIKYSFAALLALDVGIVFFNLHLLFSFLIEDILHETITLHGRTGIWEAVKERIAQSPIIGHGTETSYTFSIAKGINTFNQSTHNNILYLVFITGILGAVWFLFLCFRFLRKVGMDNHCGIIIHITLATFSLMWISEQLKGFEMFLIVAVVAESLATMKDKMIEQEVENG